MVLALGAISLATAAMPQQPSGDAAARAARYEQLYAQTPNPALLWLIAEAHAEAGQDQKAIAALEQVAERKLGFVVTPESPLNRLAGTPAFDRLAERLQRDFPTVRRAREAITVSMPGLVPEGVAVRPGTGQLFLSDLAGRTILLVSATRPARVFARTGKLDPLGMKVDAQRSLLWVAASSAFWPTDKPESALLAFDVRSGKLRRSYSSSELKSVNDLAIARNGDIYVTDSLGGAVFRLRRGAGRLERVTEAAKMSYPNGIAMNPDGKSLYVAQGVALRRVDSATGQVSTVAQPPNLAILSIDGLYWHRGSLIGIQNGGNPGRVLRFNLSVDGSRIDSFDVLEAGNPDFDVPTTGTLRGEDFYFIANSQLTRLQGSGRISEGAPLKPVKLLKLPIAPK